MLAPDFSANDRHIHISTFPPVLHVHSHNDNANTIQMFFSFTILDKKPVGMVLKSKLKSFGNVAGLVGI